MDLQAFLEATLGQWELLVRLLVACICGCVIGVERSFRQKEAGIRTHVILALASALIMVVSKYGFFDLAGTNMNADGSRIASNIVTGISFLGAGVIFVRGGSIKGLTTAAGMWATAAVGIALGYGFYVGAVIATVGCVFTAAFLSRIERKRKENTHIYMELDVTKKINNVLDKIRNELDPDALIEPVSSKSNVANTIGIYVTVSNLRTVDEIKEHIDGIDGIVLWVME